MKKNEAKKFRLLAELMKIIIDQRELKAESNNDTVILKKKLQEEGYFNLINGLEDIINEPNLDGKYYGNYTVSELFNLYELNRKVRELIFSEIGRFETHLKTLIAHYFCKKYPEWDDYQKKANYKNVTINDRSEVFMAYNGYSKKYQGTKINMRSLFPFFRMQEKNGLKYIRNKRYMSSYGNHPPLWIAIKILEFGELRIMFSMLESDVAKKVLNDFGYTSEERNKFESILNVVNWLRNECAHFEMINKSVFRSKYPLDKDLIQDLKLNVSDSRRNLNIFQVIYILNDVQAIEEKLRELLESSDLSKQIKMKYLFSLGYWDDCNWNIC